MNMIPEASADAERLFREVQQLASVLKDETEMFAVKAGLTGARYAALQAMADNPLTVPAIGRALGQSRQSVQSVADRLVKDGFASRKENPGHIRSPLLVPTPKGEAALKQIAEGRVHWLAQVTSQAEGVNIRIAAGVIRGLSGAIKKGE